MGPESDMPEATGEDLTTADSDIQSKETKTTMPAHDGQADETTARADGGKETSSTVLVEGSGSNVTGAL